MSVVFDGTGLEADPDILAHVTEVLNTAARESLDDAYFALVAAGQQRYSAARSVGLDPLQVYRRLKMDARFAERMRIADAEAMEPVIASLRTRAISDDDTRAAIKLIESKSAEEYGPKPIQLDINASTEDYSNLHPVLRHIRELEAEIIKTKAITTGAEKDEDDG